MNRHIKSITFDRLVQMANDRILALRDEKQKKHRMWGPVFFGSFD